jgi:hypothetical protein
MTFDASPPPTSDPSSEIAEFWSHVDERIRASVQDALGAQFGAGLIAGTLHSSRISGQESTLQWILDGGGQPLVAPFSRRFIFDYPVQFTGLSVVSSLDDPPGTFLITIGFYHWVNYTTVGKVMMTPAAPPGLAGSPQFRDYELSTWLRTTVPPGSIVEATCTNASGVQEVTVGFRVLRMG